MPRMSRVECPSVSRVPIVECPECWVLLLSAGYGPQPALLRKLPASECLGGVGCLFSGGALTKYTLLDGWIRNGPVLQWHWLALRVNIGFVSSGLDGEPR